jgi:hypothetical protein
MVVTKNLKEVHGLVTKKAKLGKLSIFENGFQHQDHVKMNIHILGNAMVVRRWNDQKVTNCVRAEVQREWDKLVIVVEQCPPLPKLTLVKLVHVFSLNA